MCMQNWTFSAKCSATLYDYLLANLFEQQARISYILGLNLITGVRRICLWSFGLLISLLIYGEGCGVWVFRFWARGLGQVLGPNCHGFSNNNNTMHHKRHRHCLSETLTHTNIIHII